MTEQRAEHYSRLRGMRGMEWVTRGDVEGKNRLGRCGVVWTNETGRGET